MLGKKAGKICRSIIARVVSAKDLKLFFFYEIMSCLFDCHTLVMLIYLCFKNVLQDIT